MKLSSPAATRNVGPIGDVLAGWLPAGGLVLEVASGSGEHALAFARRFPAALQWQPSDPDAAALASIETWRVQDGALNLLPPLRLDVTAPEWPVSAADAVLAINMVHISPWEASLGLLDGAARLLPPGGPLILYGPWIVDGEETAPSNLLFDADLRRRDPSWGLRRVAVFAEEAVKRGLVLEAEQAMPANNRMLLFRSAAA
jgi:hypothetical protein